METPKPIDYLDPDFQNVIEADDIALKEELNKVKLLEVTQVHQLPRQHHGHQRANPDYGWGKSASEGTSIARC